MAEICNCLVSTFCYNNVTVTTEDDVRTNAQRQRDFRAKQRERIATADPQTWTEQECLIVLGSPKYRGKAQRQWAYKRLAAFI